MGSAGNFWDRPMICKALWEVSTADVLMQNILYSNGDKYAVDFHFIQNWLGAANSNWSGCLHLLLVGNRWTSSSSIRKLSLRDHLLDLLLFDLDLFLLLLPLLLPLLLLPLLLDLVFVLVFDLLLPFVLDFDLDLLDLDLLDADLFDLDLFDVDLLDVDLELYLSSFTCFLYSFTSSSVSPYLSCHFLVSSFHSSSSSLNYLFQPSFSFCGIESQYALNLLFLSLASPYSASFSTLILK